MHSIIVCGVDGKLGSEIVPVRPHTCPLQEGHRIYVGNPRGRGVGLPRDSTGSCLFPCVVESNHRPCGGYGRRRLD